MLEPNNVNAQITWKHFTIIENNRLMLFKEGVVIYSEKHKNPITHCHRL